MAGKTDKNGKIILAGFEPGNGCSLLPAVDRYLATWLGSLGQFSDMVPVLAPGSPGGWIPGTLKEVRERMTGRIPARLILAKNGQVLRSAAIWLPGKSKTAGFRANCEVREQVLREEVARFFLEEVRLMYLTGFEYEVYLLVESAGL